MNPYPPINGGTWLKLLNICKFFQETLMPPDEFALLVQIRTYREGGFFCVTLIGEDE